MKKFFTMLSSILLLQTAFSSCSSEEQGDPFEIVDNCGLEGKSGEEKMTICDVPEDGKEDSLTGAKGLPTSVDSSETAVWEVRNQWDDTDTAEARQAGMAWGANSGLTWDEKFDRWVQSMQKIPGYNTYYDTFELVTPWGKTIQAPLLECAEVAIFLRVTFASWYGLPFFLEASDSRGNRLYFGHFGARTASGRYGHTPKFKSWYHDYTSSYDGTNWPSDEKLRQRKIPGNSSDIQGFLGDEAHAGAYFDEIFLNKRVGYFLCLTLAYFGSINLASSANTYFLKPEAIKAGDLLIERWQKRGIGHVMVIKYTAPIEGGNLEAQIVSGSMPRRQPKWGDSASSKRYFTSDECGGPGTNYDGDYYYKLGGGVRRFRSAKIVAGRWTNVVLDIHRNDWISDHDYDAIKARPEQFESLLGEVSPEQKREVLLRTIEDNREHLRLYPASCSARIQREDAFDELYSLCQEHFGMTKAQTDKQYRKLEDYVFAELEYEQSKTCCWNSTTSAMYDIIMAYNEEYVQQGGSCQEPVVFMARDATGGSDGYQIFRDYAQSIGRGAEWVDWSEDEGCPQRGVQNDTQAEHSWIDYCELDQGGGGNCPDEFDGNSSMATAASISAGTMDNLAVCDNVPDWFEINAPDGQTITVTIKFTHSSGDLDLDAFDSNGNKVASSATTSNEESIKMIKHGPLFVKVFGYQGDSNSYTMTVSTDGAGGGDDPCPDSFSGNDSRENAAELGAGSWDGLEICNGVSDWFFLPASLGSQAVVSISFQHSIGDLDMEAFSESGQELASSDSTSDEESVTIDLNADRYIMVLGYQNASNSYSLSVQVEN